MSKEVFLFFLKLLIYWNVSINCAVNRVNRAVNRWWLNFEFIISYFIKISTKKTGN